MNISIVIPVYNGEETLKLCLDSIRDITIPDGTDVEVLLINDGSTDKTKEIAQSYPNVKIIDLETNMGRVIARETGAKESKYEDILFLDSRIEASNDILSNIMKIAYSPLMAGELSINKYGSDLETLFYLIRRKIYWPYFPQNKYSKELLIDKNNFLNAPKGTTCLFIKRDLFLDCLPDTNTKDTSDDTKLLKNIVFGKEIKILRHTDVAIKYKQRTEKSIYSWIHHRGRIWADHYLSFINKYSIMYLIINLALLMLVIKNVPLAILFILGIIILVAAYLAEEVKDVFLILKTLPVLALLFYLGTLEKLFKKLIHSDFFKKK